MRVRAYESSAPGVARPGGWLDWVAKTLCPYLYDSAKCAEINDGFASRPCTKVCWREEIFLVRLLILLELLGAHVKYEAVLLVECCLWITRRAFPMLPLCLQRNVDIYL